MHQPATFHQWVSCCHNSRMHCACAQEVLGPPSICCMGADLYVCDCDSHTRSAIRNHVSLNHTDTGNVNNRLPLCCTRNFSLFMVHTFEAGVLEHEKPDDGMDIRMVRHMLCNQYAAHQALETCGSPEQIVLSMGSALGLVLSLSPFLLSIKSDKRK